MHAINVLQFTAGFIVAHPAVELQQGIHPGRMVGLPGLLPDDYATRSRGDQRQHVPVAHRAAQVRILHASAGVCGGADLDAFIGGGHEEGHLSAPGVAHGGELVRVDLGARDEIVHPANRVPRAVAAEGLVDEEGRPPELVVLGDAWRHAMLEGVRIEVFGALALSGGVDGENRIALENEPQAAFVVEVIALALGRVAADENDAGHGELARLGTVEIRGHVVPRAPLVDDLLDGELLAVDHAHNARVQGRL